MAIRRLVLTFMIFSMMIFSSQGEAGKVMSLKEIDALIDATDYNSALNELASYMTLYPKDFDSAQKRVARILKKRKEFNKNASELVQLIKVEGGNRSEKLERIQSLEKAESAPTDNVVEFTNLARRTVTLGEVLISYNRIMHEGIALVRAEKYPEAAKKFEEGFDIKNDKSDIVYEAGSPADENDQGILVVYEKDITEPVKNSISRVESLVASDFRNCENECEKAYRDFIQAVGTKNIELTGKAFEKVRSAFAKYAVLRNKIMDEVKILSDCDKLANERNPLLLGTSYITFYQKFIVGDDGSPDSGVLGAMDAYWNTRVESMKSKVDSVMYNALADVRNEIPSDLIYENVNKISSLSTALAQAGRFSEMGLKVNSLYEMPRNFDGSSVASNLSGYSNSMGFAFDFINNLILSFEEVKKLSGEENNTQLILAETNITQTLLAEALSKVRMFEKIRTDSNLYLKRVAEEYKKENDYYEEQERKRKAREELMEIAGDSYVPGEVKRSTAGVQINDNPLDLRVDIEYFITITNGNVDRANGFSENLWGFLAQAYCIEGKDSYDDFQKRIGEAQALLDGTEDAEDGGFVKKYPVEARKLASDLIAQITAKKDVLKSERTILDEGKRFAENELYENGKNLLEKIIVLFDDLNLRNREIVAKAEPQIRQFDIAFEEGKNQYRKALAAFNKNDFDAANAAVDVASEKLAEALDCEYSEEARKLREETLLELANSILVAENEQVIRDVFVLKEQATNYYYSSNFDQAENTLVQAQVRWAKTNPEPDPEIEDLLTIVKNVKSLSFGRVLSTSDPHYPELSYSLDMAKISFERGIEYKKKNQNGDAEGAFNTALANIRNVQNVYPLNKEARLIALKIQRETDPEGFPKQFENQYNAARNNGDRNEKLAELQDLYAINPSYPGLAKEIYELEEQLGMHPKREVKKENKKNVTAKINEAKKLFKSAPSSESALSKALAVVNEAIAMDGTNKEAKNLKLEIQLKLGSNVTAILSQADEKMYAEAGRLFNQRKFAEANEVMEVLWNKPAAKRSRKVIDLRNRILRRL